MLSPFMGWDSVDHYLKHGVKAAFLLSRTSNFVGDDLKNQWLSSARQRAPRTAVSLRP